MSAGSDHGENTHTHPVPHKAVLRTKVAIFDTNFQTRRTLQRPGFIVAVCSEALASRHGRWVRWIVVHAEGRSRVEVEP